MYSVGQILCLIFSPSLFCVVHCYICLICSSVVAPRIRFANLGRWLSGLSITEHFAPPPLPPPQAMLFNHFLPAWLEAMRQLGFSCCTKAKLGP